MNTQTIWNRLILFCGLLIMFSSFRSSDENSIFIGTWNYSFTILGTKRFELKEDSGLVLSKFIFFKCDYNKEDIPRRDVLLGNYKRNYFKDICTETYFNKKLIQRGYPDGVTIDSNKYVFVDYGKDNKDNYVIRTLGYDTLVIESSRMEIEISNQETIYSNGKRFLHYYIREK